MSKKKRSKIMAALLCATTMAAFYTAPQMVYAESLYYDADGMVTTDGGNNTQITNIDNLESISFGVGGDLGTAGMTLYMDTSYNGLVLAKPVNNNLDVRGSALTVGDLYIVADDSDDATDGQNRYSLRNVLGIQREGTGLDGITKIETGDGHGGVEIRYDYVNILDGTATFQNGESQTDGGTINFDGKFNSEQGMTVGSDYSLDSRGNIITSGTFNEMEIADNKVNDVTLLDGEVEADEVTASSGSNQYKLTEVGKNVSDIANKTQGIISYDPSTGTTFNGKITAYSGVQTTTLETTKIVSGNDSFTVLEARETIDWVDEWGNKVSGYDGRITANETAISGLDGRLSTAESSITANTSAIETNKTNITSLTGRVDTAEADITANETAISGLDGRLNTAESSITANTSAIETNKTNITSLTGRVDTAEADITANETAISGLDGRLSTAESSITANTSAIETNKTNITSLTGRVDTAETDITALEKKTHGFDPDGNTLNLNSITATTGTVGNVTFNGGVATGLTAIEGDSVTVAGTAISKGSFNGVNIANTDGKASINGISIYQDQGDYYVGNVNISDLTSGSGTTVEGIVRTENGEGGHITTIEQNLKVNTNGTISNRNDSFQVDASGNVTANDFKVGTNSFNTVVNDVTALKTTVGNESSGLVKDVDDLQTTVGNADSGLVHDVNGLTETVGEHTTSIGALETTVGNESSGLVKGVNDIQQALIALPQLLVMKIVAWLKM